MSWTAVDWRVHEANAGEFPQRWREMMEFAKAQVGTLEWARLIQVPTIRPTSSRWGRGGTAGPTPPSRTRSSRLLQGCEALCREVTGGPGTEVITV